MADLTRMLIDVALTLPAARRRPPPGDFADSATEAALRRTLRSGHLAHDHRVAAHGAIWDRRHDIARENSIILVTRLVPHALRGMGCSTSDATARRHAISGIFGRTDPQP